MAYMRPEGSILCTCRRSVLAQNDAMAITGRNVLPSYVELLPFLTPNALPKADVLPPGFIGRKLHTDAIGTT